MKPLHYTASALALGLALMGNAQAVTTIPFWHSMEGELGKEVDSLAQRFNAENPDYKIVPTYKGNYEQNLSAGIAAFRTGNAPAILQVYEVGTATMMASKAIKPVYDVFKEAGIQFDESQFVPTVSGYYSDSKTGHLLSQPFNSSTPVLYYNKDAFKKAGLDPEQPPKTWQDLKAAYDLTREQGFYEKNPGADTATRQMLNKPPLPFTKGLRLGNMPQIRVIVDEELESVWTGKKTPQQALDTAVERGNQLLRRFEKSTKS